MARKYAFTFLVMLLGLAACVSREPQRITLANLDSEFAKEKSEAPEKDFNRKVESGLPHRSTLDVQYAYDQYVKYAPEDDVHRKVAIRRLADIELQLSQELVQQQGVEEFDSSLGEEAENTLLIDKSQALYRELLYQFPTSENNDEILYRLAHIAEKKGEIHQSVDYLEKLIHAFPKSRYFNEAQFRIAEQAFANGEYPRAEMAYSAVIFSPQRSVFYQRSLFKRGWTRYKQRYYYEAVDDYLLAISALEVGGEKPEFFEAQSDEYHKAIALAFAKHGELHAIENYFQEAPSEALLFRIYQEVSLLFLQQARYFDSAMLYTQYLTSHPDSSFYFNAHNERIKIWQESGFKSKFIESIESFYLAYRSSDENMPRREGLRKNILRPLLEKYGLAIASHYHMLTKDERSVDEGATTKNVQMAKQWYQYYMEDFDDSAGVVGVYYQYADLLAQLNQVENALSYYRKAAYENTYLNHKEAAYALVSLMDEIPASVDQNGKAWLQSQLKAAQQFCERFQSDHRANQMAVHVGKKALDGGGAAQSVYLLEACLSAGVTPSNDFNILLGEGYFELADYANAEKNFGLIHSEIRTETVSNRLALSIFQQGEVAQRDNNNVLAIFHFSRIATITPHSSIAATGLYQAISLSMTIGELHQAIKMSEEFRSVFPQNKFTPDVLKTLSIAYLNTEQPLLAANRLSEVAQLSKNDELKRAALFQAGELYESQGQWQRAIENYRQYAHTYLQPLDQYMEATYSLSFLYEKLENQKNADFWRRKTVSSGERFAKELSSDRAQYIVANEALVLGRRSFTAFKRYKLVQPLQSNLKNKKRHMQDASRYFKVAARFPFTEIKTEAIFQIGKVYADFSVALLDSERPNSLSEIELEQYEILLEDQAFPFEDQAIELYENNLRLASVGVFSQWTKRSLVQLEKLYPARYKKEFRVDAVIYDD